MPEDPFALVPANAVVAVAMSGGVDSSVAAAHVAGSGRRAFAITLAMWPGDETQQRDRGCCSIDAVEDARRVAVTLGLRHYVWNVERDFHDAVVEPWVDEHLAGRTPNPCTRCNERVKFGLLLQRARAAGATHLATGHYARRGRRGDAATLHRARDHRRDQSYVLHRLAPHQLAAAVFPLGGAGSKAEVRAQAAALGLGTAAKPDSQDLCFVTLTPRDELRRRAGDRLRPGPVVDLDGAVVGSHDGVGLFTVGQRTGLGLPPRRPDQARRYVLELRPADATVVVGERERLARRGAELADCRWVGRAPSAGERLAAQLRAHGTPRAAAVGWVRGDRAGVGFDRPVEQVSPGQALVLYDGDEVIGGGVIVRAA